MRHRIGFGLLVFASLCVQSSFTQVPSTMSVDDRKATELLFRYASLPAEYRADLYLSTYAQMSSHLTPEMNRRYLKVISLAAARMHYPTMIEYAARSPESGASQSMRSLAGQRLDGLDIEARVITLALPAYPDFAAEALSLAKVDPPRSTCKNPTVPELDRYYEAAAAVLDSHHVEKIGVETKAEFTSRSVREYKNPVQLPQLMRLVTKIGPDAAHLQEYSARLTDKMEKIPATDREMVALLEPLTTSVPPFVALMVKNGLPTSRFLQAYRTFLVDSLTGPGCADLSADRKLAVKGFGSLLAAHPGSTVFPLALEDLKASGTGPAVEDPQIQIDHRISQPFQRLYAMKQARLVAAQRLLPAPDEQINPEDVHSIIEFALSSKPADPACAECLFAGRAYAFFSLANTLPAGQDLERSLDAYIDFLSFNKIEEEEPTAFLVPLKQLINLSRPLTEKGKQELAEYAKKYRGNIFAPSEEAEFVRKELHRSTDPVIKAYMVFEDTFHPAFEVPGEGTR